MATMITTYVVHGFPRGDYQRRYSILVDVERGASPFEQARRVIGDADLVFSTSMNVTEVVADNVKNVLFHSDPDLYAAVPQLAPHRKPRRSRRHPEMDD